ncbi:MAG: beta-lactamase family protein [Planctomycetaceae bacterium]|nr:beta-lactamase family protein [Planctomycetaceae bacterium]
MAPLNRRMFLQTGIAGVLTGRACAAQTFRDFESAADILRSATASGQVAAASLCVRSRQFHKSWPAGKADSPEAVFLLASISKTITVAAVMTLFDEGAFALDESVSRFLPEFTGDNRERVTIRHLMTHTSGLPDQLPQNAALRSRHAPLSEFVDATVRTPLLFSPGTQYGYSSMGILLASEIACRITSLAFSDLVSQRIYQPLEMKRSAMGLGEFQRDEVMQGQLDDAAPESGAGDPNAKSWDWNSSYWRHLGAPWGGAHGSASDVAIFLDELLHRRGVVVKPETAALMTSNHNPPPLHPRGLGFDLGPTSGNGRGSNRQFGHTGSTGTLCWADPETETICVVLTTLPGRAVSPHPRDLVSAEVARVSRQ